VCVCEGTQSLWMNVFLMSWLAKDGDH